VRRVLRSLSGLLLMAGILLLADALTTLVWQEPVSALYSRLQQGRLDDRLAQLERGPADPRERRLLARMRSAHQRLAFSARSLNRRTHPGDPLGRIRMASIGLTSVVVAGTNASSLRRGPGHYPGTPLPGVAGTVAVAGHRTTYGAPFRRLDRLDKGDSVELRMPYGRFVYRVERTRIVAPTATWVTRRVGYDRLVLSACHPLYSAAKRIVVFARLVEEHPGGRIA
jgi:sortase A